MSAFPQGLRRAIQLLARLPGVGEKSAQRYALELTRNLDLASELGAALSDLKLTVTTCQSCGNLAERRSGEPGICPICADPRRDPKILCIVARVQDLLAIERSGAMRGRYFVLGRLLSPLDGVSASDLPLAELLGRVSAMGPQEILLATPPSIDGEATALYLARELEARGFAVTRIASGVPHGGDLEFADQITLGRAIEGRRKF
jgi:recombination protein RecR